MPTVHDSYARLSEETKRQYSITFWRTVNGFWGARAGLGDHAFGPTIERAIEAAVTNAIAAQKARTSTAAWPTVISDATT